MDERLQEVRDFANKAHGEQLRRYSREPYIVHPQHVMETVIKYNNDVAVLSAALLHDVLEDTDMPAHKIQRFLQTLMSPVQAEKTVKLVQQLTDVYTKKNFPQWNRRKRKTKEAERLERASPEAQTIKYADIIDNCPEIIREDPDFAKRYLSECRDLLRRMTKGNAELRQAAIDAVENAARENIFSTGRRQGP
jgi:guanosine-3',5'-bis(diphosphate) 3'-pyrophosphohydrolase